MLFSQISKNLPRYAAYESAALRQVKGALQRPKSTRTGKIDIEALLREPSWSVRETLFSDKASEDAALVSKEKLHHLLRLSALPAPASSQEESKMIEDLEAQLRFVQAIQKVNTEGIEPLQMIRDERKEAQQRNTVTIDSLKEEFEKEEVVGTRGRIRKKKTEEPDAQVERDKWNPLRHASKTQGSYFIVNTAKG